MNAKRKPRPAARKTTAKEQQPYLPGELGVIEPGKLYTRDAVCSIMGIGNVALRTARRKGLRPVMRFGKQFFHGQHIIDYCTDPE